MILSSASKVARGSKLKIVDVGDGVFFRYHLYVKFMVGWFLLGFSDHRNVLEDEVKAHGWDLEE